MANCYQCEVNEVPEEFDRCPSCKISHQELIKKLDSKPRVKEKKVKEELFPIKEMKGGIPVTTWISREDAANMGITLPAKKEL